MEDGRQTLELAPADLRRHSDPANFDFETTSNLAAPLGMVGQERAQEAIDFALEMDDSRYNLFVNGEPGTGRRIAVATAVEAIAKSRPAAQDWCYVYHFDQPEEPHAIPLPPGMGRMFAHDIAAFVQTGRRELRHAFNSESYAAQRKDLLKDIEPQHTSLWNALSEELLALGFMLRSNELGIALLPIRPAGERADQENTDAEPQILSREEIDAMPVTERDRLIERRDQAEAVLKRKMPAITTLEDEMATRIRSLISEVAEQTLAHSADALIAQYTLSADAVDFLRRLRNDMATHADVLRGEGDDGSGSAGNEADGGEDDDQTGEIDGDGRVSLKTLLRRYRVNVLVSHKAEDTAPIVMEMNPSRTTLLGRIESGTKRGMPFTDHLMIRAGALHRANGGFLIVQAHDLISSPAAWETLKRALRFGMIAMDGGESQGNQPGVTLRPEPIPANVKAILIGDLMSYRELLQDPEFRLLFKVRADFDEEMARTPEAEYAYARFAGNVARSNGGPALGVDAVVQLIEEGSRWADDQERLSAEFGSLRDLTLEACYWAKKDQAERTTAAHVRRAIEARERRGNLSADKYNELIHEGQLVIETDGEVAGQVNGLSVRLSTDHVYGVPMRITARTSPGVVGVIDIERETAMSGPSHSKGVLILSGFLAGRFAQDFPLSLSASVCFEQNYEPIDGDSASSAELYALLSSLSGVPIRQSLAVTGSVNQRGEIQAVGAVTAKVESFYQLCEARGLTSRQGVLIPRANVRNLMLREEIVEAVRAGKFHIYAINTVDEGIELLTGIPAGKPNADNRYLEGTINARISQVLRVYSDRVRAYTGNTAGRPAR